MCGERLVQNNVRRVEIKKGRTQKESTNECLLRSTRERRMRNAMDTAIKAQIGEMIHAITITTKPRT